MNAQHLSVCNSLVDLGGARAQTTQWGFLHILMDNFFQFAEWY